jgi:hypothetical protein
MVGGALAMVVLVVLNVWGTSVEEIVVARAARLAAVVWYESKGRVVRMEDVDVRLMLLAEEETEVARAEVDMDIVACVALFNPAPAGVAVLMRITLVLFALVVGSSIRLAKDRSAKLSTVEVGGLTKRCCWVGCRDVSARLKPLIFAREPSGVSNEERLAVVL